MEITRENVLKIINLITGLDGIGRARLDKAVKRLSGRDKLPEEVEALLNTLDDLADDETIEVLLGLARLFGMSFKSGVKNGVGADIWFDDMGEINLEVDVVRARQKVVNPQSEYAALQGQGGSVQTGQTAKIKKIRR